MESNSKKESCPMNKIKKQSYVPPKISLLYVDAEDILTTSSEVTTEKEFVPTNPGEWDSPF